MIVQYNLASRDPTSLGPVTKGGHKIVPVNQTQRQLHKQVVM